MSKIKGKLKGIKFEREIVQEFREMGWEKAKRSRETVGGEGVDLAGTRPFTVQCKKWKQYAPVSVLKEIPESGTEYALAILGADRKPTIAVMYWEDLKEILQAGRVEGWL